LRMDVSLKGAEMKVSMNASGLSGVVDPASAHPSVPLGPLVALAKAEEKREELHSRKYVFYAGRFPDKAMEQIEGWECITEEQALRDHPDWFDFQIIEGIVSAIDEAAIAILGEGRTLADVKLSRVEYEWDHLLYDAHIEYETVGTRNGLWTYINFRLSNDGFRYAKALQAQNTGVFNVERHGSKRHGDRPPSKTWCLLKPAVYQSKLSKTIAFAARLIGSATGLQPQMWFDYAEQRLDLDVVSVSLKRKVQFSFHPNWGPKSDFYDYWVE